MMSSACEILSLLVVGHFTLNMGHFEGEKLTSLTKQCSEIWYEISFHTACYIV